MTIYINSEYKCHISNDGTMRAFDVPDFNGKAPAWIEGRRYVPPGESWVRSDGHIFHGKMISPWRDSAQLDEFQRQYEAQLAAAATAYTEGVNSI